ncbi:hypothetical protein [Arenicella xantha]|uniref:Uncharacterized protein n=1 Tax=Arenicella xantha TaxID=644221 RepID=A0A395JKF5_9GAMM|nr:hypothetical protein [Arenicella xantha]RBP51029.1 hypothetical protein DFR28_102448 [Arenicella xantha]
MPSVALRLENYRDLFSETMDEAVLNDIGVMTQKGLIFGTSKEGQVFDL